MTKKRILDTETYVAQTNTTNMVLASIAKAIEGKGNTLDVNDVSEFARYLGAGFGKVCSIGKQFSVPKKSSIVITIGHAENHTSNLNATIDADVFLAAIGEVREHIYEYTFDGLVWHDEEGKTIILSDYGISATGTPVVGDIIAVKETASQVAFDLVQYNPEGYTYPYDTLGKGDTAMLLSHNIQAYGTIQFHRSCLLYYAKSMEMPAGTYKFTLNKAAYGSGSQYDGDYYFTITRPIPRFGGFSIHGIGGWKAAYAKTDVTSSKVTTYSAKFTSEATCTPADKYKHIRMETVESNIAIYEYTSGISYTYDLGTFSARDEVNFEVEDTTSGLGGMRNRTEHNSSGDNRWKNSLFYLWGNSTANASTGDGLGNWFYYRTVFEISPNATICNLPGYLYGFGKDFLESIQTVRYNVTIPGYYFKTNTPTYEVVESKIFLPSYQEVFGEVHVSGYPEGSKLEYYKLYPNQSDRRKLYNGAYNYWFTRTARSWGSYTVIGVDPSGAFWSSYANSAYGFAPACIIKKSS